MNKKVKVASFVIGSVVCFSCLATTICVSAKSSSNEVKNKVQTTSVNVKNNCNVSGDNSNVVNPLSEKTLMENSSENIKTTTDSEFKSVKEEIWHKMLNSIDYYNNVSGKMVYADSPGEDMYVEYQTNLDESKAYTEVQEINVSDSSVAVMSSDISSCTNANTFDVEVFTNGTSLTMLDNIEKTAVNEDNSVCTRENAEEIKDDERIVIEEDGTPGYYYRCDVTNTYLASASLFPQEMTFGFLTDFELWNVDNTETYVGRKCYVISGVSSEEYGNKIGVKNFQMYVDCETGVLLKYVGYDKDENIHAYLATEEIHFEEGNAVVYKPSTAGYTFIK